MAKNVVFETGNVLSVTCADPATPASGDLVLWGDKVGVALTKETEGGNPTGKTSVKFDGVVNAPVKGVNGSGNSAVAEGDVLYYVTADTPKVSKKATGVRAGIAMGAVTSGATATIPIRLGA